MVRGWWGRIAASVGFVAGREGSARGFAQGGLAAGYWRCGHWGGRPSGNHGGRQRHVCCVDGTVGDEVCLCRRLAIGSFKQGAPLLHPIAFCHQPSGHLAAGGFEADLGGDEGHAHRFPLGDGRGSKLPCQPIASGSGQGQAVRHGHMRAAVLRRGIDDAASWEGYCEGRFRRQKRRTCRGDRVVVG